MDQDTKKITSVTTPAASFGIVIGIFMFILSLTANAYNSEYILTFISLGIIQASMFIFGFGVFLSLMIHTTNQ